MNKKSFRPRFLNILTLFVLYFLCNAPIFAQQTFESLESLSKQLMSLPDTQKCGERDEPLRLTKEIVEKYGDVKDDAVLYFKKRLPEFEKEERTCKLFIRYNNDYRTKNWKDFFDIASLILNEERDTGIALDVLLDLVSVGFHRAYDHWDDTYNKLTYHYASQAIFQIASGQTSQTGQWGILESFKSKENALGWLNFISGWHQYYKRDGRMQSVFSLYQATQYEGDKEKDSLAYELIGDYYFKAAVDGLGLINKKLDAKRVEMIRTGIKDYTERALLAYAKVYQIEISEELKDKRYEAVYKKIVDAYRFRFNIPENEEPDGLENIYLILVKQPLPAPDKKIVWVFPNPFVKE